MRLLLAHPHLAARSCGDCRRWLYADRPGRFADRPAERGGSPLPRPPAAGTPCSYCPKQPADVPEAARGPDTAVELSARNLRAFRHHAECDAVGVFPDDPIVRRNAAVVRRVEQDLADVRQLHLTLLTLGRRE